MVESQNGHLLSDSLTTKWGKGLNRFPDELNLRVRRALSWLQRAEKEQRDGDPDAAFIFYWIAFNAAYAEETGVTAQVTERGTFDAFFSKLKAVDSDGMIYSALWERFTGPIRLLLDNKFVFQPYWNHLNRIPGYEDWEARFDNGKSRIHQGLAHQDTALILGTVFDRLYVLRNQLIHGGATWNGSVNRYQVTDGARILSFLVPIFVDLMLENPDLPWGPPNYPVVGR